MAEGRGSADAIRTVRCYAGTIVIRHPDLGSAQLAAKLSPLPVLNAGDGIGEHPTQVCRVRAVASSRFGSFSSSHHRISSSA